VICIKCDQCGVLAGYNVEGRGRCGFVTVRSSHAPEYHDVNTVEENQAILLEKRTKGVADSVESVCAALFWLHALINESRAHKSEVRKKSRDGKALAFTTSTLINPRHLPPNRQILLLPFSIRR
jgi:hypothetical protein